MPAKQRVKRVVESLASSPYLVNRLQSKIVLPDNTPFDIQDFNARAASDLLLERTHVIFADEIAQYLTDGLEVCYETLAKTPRPMPCYDNLWIEGCPWTLQQMPENHFVSVGGLVQLHKLYQNPLEMEKVKEQTSKYEISNNDKEPYVGVVMFVYAVGIEGQTYGPMGRIAYLLNANFEILHDKAGPIGLYKSLSIPPIYLREQHYIKQCAALSLTMAARVIGLLNCSNVEMVEDGRTNDHVGKNRREREKLAWIKYHVLKVKVGKHLIPIQPRKEELAGYGIPLQTVRGHFKDFSKNGLFGKYKGQTYSSIWCPPFVKGNAENGVVVKDYQAIPGEVK